MRIVILDPQLKSLSGHQYTYTQALTEELTREGISHSVVANRDADSSVRQSLHARPLLTDITGDILPRAHVWLHGVRLVRFIRSEAARYTTLLASLGQPGAREKTIVYLHSYYAFELLSLALAVRRSKQLILANGMTFIVGLNFAFDRPSWIERWVLTQLYRQSCSMMQSALRDQVQWCSEIPLLRIAYECLLHRPVHRVPLPLYTPWVENVSQTSPHGAAGEEVVVGFMGGARYNKGFDIAVAIAEAMCVNQPIPRVRFLFQVDVHRHQTYAEHGIVQQAIVRLQDLAARHSEICIIAGAVDRETYYTSLLGKSDIVLLPYRSSAFGSSLSSIFREAVVMGKIPIVSANTSMAVMLQEFALPELIVALQHPQAWRSAVNLVIAHQASIRRRMAPLVASQRQDTSAHALVAALQSIVSFT